MLEYSEYIPSVFVTPRDNKVGVLLLAKDHYPTREEVVGHVIASASKMEASSQLEFLLARLPPGTDLDPELIGENIPNPRRFHRLPGEDYFSAHYAELDHKKVEQCKDYEAFDRLVRIEQEFSEESFTVNALLRDNHLPSTAEINAHMVRHVVISDYFEMFGDLFNAYQCLVDLKRELCPEKIVTLHDRSAQTLDIVSMIPATRLVSENSSGILKSIMKNL